MQYEDKYNAVKIEKTLIAEILWRLFEEGLGPLTDEEAVTMVLRRYLHGEAARAELEDDLGGSSQDKDDEGEGADYVYPGPGYIWESDAKEIFLPDGTEVMMVYKGHDYVAKVVGNDLMFEDQIVSPAGFARRIGGTGRNARTSLKIKRPGKSDYILAKTLFDTEGLKSKRKPTKLMDDDYPDILYRDAVLLLDKLDELNFPDKLFRKLHHKGDTKSGFKRYALLGIQAGKEDTRCKWGSNNGRIVRRVQHILDHYTGQTTDAEWMPLVTEALQEIPFKD